MERTGGDPGDPPPPPAPRSGGRPPVRFANPFGLWEALLGLAAAELLSAAAIGLYGALAHRPAQASSLGGELCDLAGVWLGFFGAVVLASATWHRRPSEGAGTGLLGWLQTDYGLALRPLDLPLGVAVGVASQYLLVPLLELPLLPFVPHLFQRLGGPAQQVTGPATGGGLVVLGLFICVGSPFFEECFFRGLLLRALVGKLAPLGPRVAGAGGVVVCGLVFGLVHFEALQFLGLAGFGMVLCLLARRTGRLGPGMVAHLSFNAVTVIAIALSR